MIAAAILALSMIVHPFCVDDEQGLVWTVDVDANGTVSAIQGTDPESAIDAREVLAGAENMMVVGLAGNGPVTFTLDGTDVSVTKDGGTKACWPTKKKGAVSTTGTVARQWLPPTDTETPVYDPQRLEILIAVFMFAFVVGFAILLLGDDR